MSTADHHSEYLAKAIDALTPEGHKRVDELLDQLAEVVGDHEAVARFAAARKAEADCRGDGILPAVTPRTRAQPTGAGRPDTRLQDDPRSRAARTTSPTGQMPSWRCSKTKPTTTRRADPLRAAITNAARDQLKTFTARATTRPRRANETLA